MVNAPSESKRLLCELAHPGGQDGFMTAYQDLAHEDSYPAQMYVWRDASCYPNLTVGERRTNIVALLDGGPPYGKITCNSEVIDAMATWRIALAGLSPEASLLEVYELAPERCLTFLGF